MQGKFSFNQFFSEKLKEKLENAGIGRSLAQSFPQNLSCFGFLLILKISISKNYQNFNKLNAQILNPSVFFFLLSRSAKSVDDRIKNSRSP